MSRKLGRNDPCHCGSGKKYKRCCLDKDAPPTLPTPPNPEPPLARPAPPSTRPLFDASEIEAAFAVPQGPRDEWHERYSAAEVGEKQEMLLALLRAGHPVAHYEEEDFVGQVLDFECCLTPDQHDLYVAVLEAVLTERPDVFRLGREYFVRDLAYAYVNAGRGPEIAKALDLLVQTPIPVDEPVFDLLDLLRLAGLEAETRTLLLAILRERDALHPCAIRELIDIIIYYIIHEDIENINDLFNEAVGSGLPEDLCGRLRGLGYKLDESRVLTTLAHWLGARECDPESTELRGRNESANFNLYLLSLDFGRWLTSTRKMAPVTAEAWRHFVYLCLLEMTPGGRKDPLMIQNKELAKYVRSFLGFISLNQLRAVATVIALPAFYEFLLTKGFIRTGQFGRAIAVIGDIRSEISPLLVDPRWPFAFLRQYEEKVSQAGPRREEKRAATA